MVNLDDSLAFETNDPYINTGYWVQGSQWHDPVFMLVQKLLIFVDICENTLYFMASGSCKTSVTHVLLSPINGYICYVYFSWASWGTNCRSIQVKTYRSKCWFPPCGKTNYCWSAPIFILYPWVSSILTLHSEYTVTVMGAGGNCNTGISRIISGLLT